MLVEAAWAASRKKNTYFSSKFNKMIRRTGKKRALVAIAHKILTASYFILRDKVEYKELGPNYLDQLNESRAVSYYAKRLRSFGYDVKLQKVA